MRAFGAPGHQERRSVWSATNRSASACASSLVSNEPCKSGLHPSMQTWTAHPDSPSRICTTLYLIMTAKLADDHHDASLAGRAQPGEVTARAWGTRSPVIGRSTSCRTVRRAGRSSISDILPGVRHRCPPHPAPVRTRRRAMLPPVLAKVAGSAPARRRPERYRVAPARRRR